VVEPGNRGQLNSSSCSVPIPSFVMIRFNFGRTLVLPCLSMVETKAMGRGVIPQVIILYMAALFRSLPGSISLNGLSAVKPSFSSYSPQFEVGVSPH
jgi:hypothetical protein